ncbi:MAG: hypothetical protein LC114_18600 [Bryobacterales bacterium]|nr:hypothetical protein [Bryobacterales bacterium]
MSAHFFRRAFTLLKLGGSFGLIATNTISQGDTRSTGLRWICGNGGVIYRARKRYKWPGQAAVVVSVVHVHKGALQGPYYLDGRPVDRITAYLFHAGGSEDPETLIANDDKSFQGSIVLGMGFTFDDSDRKGVASSLEEMRRVVTKDQRNADRILPYIGGEELNESPVHAHHRYVISFEDFPLRRKETGPSWQSLTGDGQDAQLKEGVVAPDCPIRVASDWPDLIAILHDKVKAKRETDKRELYRRYWWQHAEKRIGLYQAIRRKASSQNRVLVTNAQAAPHLAFAFVNSTAIFANSLNVFPLDTWQDLAVLQSRVHEGYAWFQSSSMKDDLRYNPTDCFETFPFPKNHEADGTLGMSGEAYYAFRATLMVRNCEGLTKTYNRFHDPGEVSDGIVELRRLHDAMDRTVLDAYGWQDIRPQCDFFPEFTDDDEGDDEPTHKKKHFRYRWPDEIRDDVLARLLILNQQRYQEEVLAGLHDKADGTRRGRRRAADEGRDEDQLEEQRELDL